MKNASKSNRQQNDVPETFKNNSRTTRFTYEEICLHRVQKGQDCDVMAAGGYHARQCPAARRNVPRTCCGTGDVAPRRALNDVCEQRTTTMQAERRVSSTVVSALGVMQQRCTRDVAIS